VEAVCEDTHRQVYNQVLPTSQKPHLVAVYRDTHREVYREVDRQVYQVNQDSTESANQERTHEVDRMVTEADFQRRLPSQCQLPMSVRCKMRHTEYAEALHRAQTVLVRLNLVYITI